jgi:hypothetical protein
VQIAENSTNYKEPVVAKNLWKSFPTELTRIPSVTQKLGRAKTGYLNHPAK